MKTTPNFKGQKCILVLLFFHYLLDNYFQPKESTKKRSCNMISYLLDKYLLLQEKIRKNLHCNEIEQCTYISCIRGDLCISFYDYSPGFISSIKEGEKYQQVTANSSLGHHDMRNKTIHLWFHQTNVSPNNCQWLSLIKG